MYVIVKKKMQNDMHSPLRWCGGSWVTGPSAAECRPTGGGRPAGAPAGGLPRASAPPGGPAERRAAGKAEPL